MGSPACIYQKGENPVKEAAEAEGKRRLTRSQAERREMAMTAEQALFAIAPSQEIGQLPAPNEALHGDNATAGSDLRGKALQDSGSGAAGAVVSTKMAAYVKSVELAEKVTQGALIQTGALPRGDKDWNSMATKHRT